MINYTFTDEKTKQDYKRITKPMARRAFCDGKTVVVCASNLRPFGFYQFQFEWNINRESFQNELKATDTTPENLFNYAVNQFEYYNCTNKETGKHASFYIAID